MRRLESVLGLSKTLEFFPPSPLRFSSVLQSAVMSRRKGGDAVVVAAVPIPVLTRRGCMPPQYLSVFDSREVRIYPLLI